jgi:hypothetical protein
VLYENGFYKEAIELLYTKIKERPDSLNLEYLQYLAFCYIAGNEPDSASAVIVKILDADSSFFPDTIATSPKILRAFSDARNLRRAPHRPEPPPSAADTVPQPSPLAAAAAVPSPRAVPEHLFSQKASLPSDWRRYMLYCMPGGTGQFYRHYPGRGVMALALQAMGLAAGYWAYGKREDAYDSNYGWNSGNREEYIKYSRLSLAGFCIFLTAYAISVSENFIRLNDSR